HIRTPPPPRPTLFPYTTLFRSPELTRSFLEEANRLLHKSVKSVSPATLEALGRYEWPGNVRELRNVIIRAALLAGETIEPAHLRSEEHTSELQSPCNLVCRLLL